MIEYAVVFDLNGRALSWYPGFSSVSIPDSSALWKILWGHREILGGVAHTHPGQGRVIEASHEDITTFSAIQRALGHALSWPIVNEDSVVYWGHNPRINVDVFSTVTWDMVVKELRRRSWNPHD